MISNEVQLWVTIAWLCLGWGAHSMYVHIFSRGTICSRPLAVEEMTLEQRLRHVSQEIAWVRQAHREGRRGDRCGRTDVTDGACNKVSITGPSFA